MFESKHVRWLMTVLLVAAAGSVIAWTGLSYRSKLFYTYDAIALGFVLPTVAVVLGRPAIWSRTLAINVALVVALLALVEGGSYLVAPPPPERDRQSHGDRYMILDPSFGYRAVPGAETRITERIAGELIYDVAVAIDGFGRRVVPYDAATARYAVLFLGGSFTFGYGVGAEQTYAAEFARQRPEYRPYIYALGGCGPSQALDVLRDRDIATEVSEPIRFVVFYLIAEHVDRAIGTTNVATNWCGHCANYELGQGGQVVRVGDLNASRPLTTIVQSALRRSNFLRAIDFTIPDPTSQSARERTAAILAALRDEVARQAPDARFVVAMHPGAEAETGLLRRMIEARGVEVIALPELYDPSDPRYVLSVHNIHPSPPAYELIGRALAERLP